MPEPTGKPLRLVDKVKGARPPKKRYALGFDPGVNFGFAVWDRQAKTLERCEAGTFWHVCQQLEAFDKAACTCWIEDPGNVSAVWAHHIRGALQKISAALKKGDFKGAEGQLRAVVKIGQRVGRVKENARLMVEYLEMMGYDVHTITPGGEKWDAEMLERVTGWTKRSNEHGRDAARMCAQR